MHKEECPLSILTNPFQKKNLNAFAATISTWEFLAIVPLLFWIKIKLMQKRQTKPKNNQHARITT